MDDFKPIEWAMQQTGMSVAEAVAAILNAGARPSPNRAKLAAARQPNQLEPLVEFVDGEFDVKAADVVARGICTDPRRANILLSEAWRAGSIDRIGHGIYAPKGTISDTPE